MKKLGFFLIILGLIIFFIMLFNLIKEKTKIISPLPEEKGVKVIFVTPTK